MSRFNTKTVPSRTVNKAGGKAFRASAKQELVHAVLSTFLEDKFYEKGNDRLARIQKLVHECSPEFVANLAYYSRRVSNLRSVTTVLIGELAKGGHTADVKDLIAGTAIRPDDVLELASYLDGKLPKQVKRGIRHAILGYDRYKLAKYRGEGKSVTMVDLFNLTHPNPKFADKEQKKAWKDLMTGKLTSFDTWETEISAAKTDAAKKKAWESLILEDKLGYMATLRNINNFVKCDINAKAKKAVIAKLTDPEEVKRSKQLPFRYFTAYQNVKDREYLEAIVEAADLSLANVPDMEGNTLIAVDCSGSMTSSVSDNGTTPLQKAAMFGAALVKANKKSDLLLYDTQVRTLKVTSAMPTLAIADSIMNIGLGGGTNTDLVFQYAIGKKYDRIIIVSDNQSWAGYGTQQAYQSLKRSGADPFVYAVDIEGYGTMDVAGGKVYNLAGWSERLLDYIGACEKGAKLLEEIENSDWRPIRTIAHPKKR